MINEIKESIKAQYKRKKAGFDDYNKRVCTGAHVDGFSGDTFETPTNLTQFGASNLHIDTISGTPLSAQESLNADKELLSNPRLKLKSKTEITKAKSKPEKSKDALIKSAQRLVKRMVGQNVCQHYQVIAEGDSVGKVKCSVCDEVLGAVSSTLKKHVITDRHKEALNAMYNSQETYPLPSLSPSSQFDLISTIDTTWLEK